MEWVLGVYKEGIMVVLEIIFRGSNRLRYQKASLRRGHSLDERHNVFHYIIIITDPPPAYTTQETL
jgi:hypothetical protein